MGRRGPARCRKCRTPIAFFRSPFTDSPRAFELQPVDATHPLAGVKAFPVHNGVKAYRPHHLAELIQVRQHCSDEDAMAEVRDMPWHLLHEHPADNDDGDTTTAKENHRP